MIWSLCFPEYSLSVRESGMGSFLRLVHRLLGCQCRQEEWAPSLYCEQLIAHRDHYLMLFFQDHEFFQSGPATSHSHAVSASPNPATLSYVSFVPLAFSPCPDAKGGIDLLAIGSSECSSSRLPRATRHRMGDR